MGTALRDGYRDRVFLMTKFDGRTKKRPPSRSTSRCGVSKPIMWI
jgi:aryl-alcohol dehydrogenase-like predicted oxidoreductase